MDAFTLMKTDHKNVKNLFSQIQKTDSADERTTLFHQLKIELDAHAHMEETVFYPAMEDQESTHDLTLESYEEHRLVKTLLEELLQLPADREEWMSKFQVLKENVEHHIEEEENEMFPKAKKILGTRSKRLGEDMDLAKQNYLDDLEGVKQ